MHQAQLELAPAIEVKSLPTQERLTPWIVPTVLILTDLITLSISGAAAVVLRGSLPVGLIRFPYDLIPIFFSIFISVFLAWDLYSGMYESAIDEFKTLVQAASVGYLMVLAAIYFEKLGHFYSRPTFLLSWAFTTIMLPLCRSAVRHWLCTKSWWATPVVVIGASPVAQEIVDVLERDPSLGLRPVALLNERGSILTHEQSIASGVLRGGVGLAHHFASNYRHCLAIVVLPEKDVRGAASLIEEYTDKFKRVWVTHGAFGVAAMGLPLNIPVGGSGFELNQHHRRLAPRIVKRGFDLALTTPLFLLLAPFVPLIALVGRLTSPGPVFYGQRRIGRDGREFIAWKFRTMVLEADLVLEQHLKANPELRTEWNVNHKLKNDPRITPIGKFLRKFSLDELPQLWNVLCGEMSIVGPRPIVRNEASKYGRCFGLYQRVPPGITGLWQISGRNNTTYEKRVQLDEYYVRHWSILLDFYILLRTIKAVVSAEGAY